MYCFLKWRGDFCNGEIRHATGVKKLKVERQWNGEISALNEIWFSLCLWHASIVEPRWQFALLHIGSLFIRPADTPRPELGGYSLLFPVGNYGTLHNLNYFMEI